MFPHKELLMQKTSIQNKILNKNTKNKKYVIQHKEDMKFYFISNHTIIFKPSKIFALFLLFHILHMEAIMEAIAIKMVVLMSNYLISIFTSIKTTRL